MPASRHSNEPRAHAPPPPGARSRATPATGGSRATKPDRPRIYRPVYVRYYNPPIAAQ
ncbi:hypothetical protein BUH_5105 [Burkholderia pseudomallei Pakistan 9]|nr:hypothetical protein BUH_5105 [Burkholderia pseudomallei Pakistan 9]